MAVQKTHKEIQTRVVGLQYRLSRSSRFVLAKRVPLIAKLVREPENRADENAVAVFLKSAPWSGVHIGYLPRAVAQEIAPRLDSKKMVSVRVTVISVDAVKGEAEITVSFRQRKSQQKRVI